MIFHAFFLALNIFCIPVHGNFKGFDDSLLFSINWLGKDSLQDVKISNKFEEMVVTSDHGESYKCTIPLVTEKEKEPNEKYTGLNGLDLLTPLLTQSACSYRLEAYWTYEVCHGKYVRQYHEEREGKKVKLQEYFLGRWDDIQSDALWREVEQEEATKPISAMPVKKIDGLTVPYLQMNMTDGTMCDLNSKPRQTRVLYVCYPLGKHEIYSFKETSICEYEVVVLSPLLCAHPRYRPKQSGEHPINCYPVDGNEATKPKSLTQFEADSLRLRHQKPAEESNVFAVFSLEKAATEDGVPRLRVEFLPSPSASSSSEPPVSSSTATSHPHNTGLDMTRYEEFITGRECVEGGNGWWKYRFCFGQSVSQYHVEKDGSRTVVNLGNFIKAGHLHWLDANPHKRPALNGSPHIYYHYTQGTICDQTGLPRQTEVKLKCVEGKGSAVTLYLLEPKTCQYILGVESQMFCYLMKHVDENGFLKDPEMGFSRADYTTGYQEPAAQPNE